MNLEIYNKNMTSEELIKVDVNENFEHIVSGRELHEKLEIKTPYKKWFDRMCEYGFLEGIDFTLLGQKCPSSNASGFKVITDHMLKIDMAKEVAMLQRNDIGRKFRRYFIEVEKEYNSPEKIMARALEIANRELNSLKFLTKAQEQQNS